MQPDRLALFGYAHVPWMKTHQRMIDETALPDAAERLRQSQAAAAPHRCRRLCRHRHRPFRPARRQAGRRRQGRHATAQFPGATPTDAAPALIGLGASSIGSLPQGYLQNITATGEYIRAIRERGLAIARGIAFSAEDRMRGWVIERLMCDFHVSMDELRHRFGHAAMPVVIEMDQAAQGDLDGVVDFDGRTFAVTEPGRPFVRSVARRFRRLSGHRRRPPLGRRLGLR